MGIRSSSSRPASIPQPRVPEKLPKPVIYRTPCSSNGNRRATSETWNDSQRNFSSRPESKSSFPTQQPRCFPQNLPSRPILHTGDSPTSYRASGDVITNYHESYSNLNDIQTNFQFLSINDQATTNYTSKERREVRPPKIVTRNPTIQLNPHFLTNQSVSYIPLSEDDSEYAEINKMITNKRRFKVDSIEKIENPYLKKAYALKKEEKEKKFGHVQERLLFHGTLQSNVESICKFNFDWRLCNAHQFGYGVCFSPNANYASNLRSDKTYNKVMIVAKVMIARSVFGRKIMEKPYLGYDTFQKGDGIVVVKYENDEFCPLYKINYHLATGNVQHQCRRRVT